MSEDQPNAGSMLKGFGIGAGLNILLMVAVAAMVNPIVLIGAGLVQLVWIVPMYLSFRRQGATETAKGILLAAGIVFLLNAACFGLVMTMGLKNMH
jgi:hypothetical protein